MKKKSEKNKINQEKIKWVGGIAVPFTEETSNTCDHWPVVYYDKGGPWKIMSHSMNQINRRCSRCGLTESISLTSYNQEMFMSEGRKYQLDKDRDDNAINMIQPIDSKTGKFNEDFGKHYGYNPLETPSPQSQPTSNDKIDDMMSGVAENNIKMEKLGK